ncbi:MAG: hypothetical protein ACOY16_08420 [Chloroflexota bacterium]
MSISPGFFWKVWLLWIFANTAGAAMGVAITLATVYWLGIDADKTITLIVVAAIAASIGISQWLIIRKYFPRAILWIAVSLAGAFLGVGAIAAITGISNSTLGGGFVSKIMQAPFSLLLPLSLYGVSIGFTQWLFLRQFALRASWWIFASTLGAALLGVAIGDSFGNIAGLVWVGTLPAIVTGIVLAGIVRLQPEDGFRVE